MEMLLIPIGLIVGGYIITRVSGFDVPAIVRDLKMLVLVVPCLGLVVALSAGAMTPEELTDLTTAIIQSATALVADHWTGVAIGTVATPIAVFLIVKVVRPMMDVFDL